jgi:hypothetical protein
MKNFKAIVLRLIKSQETLVIETEGGLDCCFKDASVVQI